MNVGLIAPGPGDGTSFYRAHGPFAYLSRETGCHLITASEWDWTNVCQCDVMFMQRPFTAAHAMVAKTCKALNVPLWVDYDDPYDCFPDWCPIQQSMFGNPEALANMRGCLAVADVVTVSTEALRALSPKAEVVPNALNTYIWPMSDRPRAKVVTWRGSGGHAGDLDPVLPALERVLRQHPDWELHLMGVPPYGARKLGKFTPYSDLLSFMESFHRLAPAIHIVPLTDCEFNRCKSNNSWLEATAAGAVTIAPDWAEWRRPGVVNYDDSEDFELILSAVLAETEANRAAYVVASRDYIEQHLTLSLVNRQRVEILKRFA